MTKADSCKATFVALLEIFGKKIIKQLTFGEGVQPWDLAGYPLRIERYRFMLGDFLAASRDGLTLGGSSFIIGFRPR